jgi:putative adhesin
MNDEKQNSNPERKSHLIILFIVISLAAASSALKELRDARAVLADVAQVISSWSDAIVPTASARTRTVKVVAETCEARVIVNSQNTSDEFHWNGPIAQGQTVEIRGINGRITAEPGTGNEVQVLAVKSSRRSDVNAVQVKVVQHSRGVTICALYPNDSGDVQDCESDSGQRQRSEKFNVKDNDVSVDFTVKVPARVSFVGKTVNGEISASQLTGNVVAKTVNGSIRISTTGYAEATTVNGEISARVGDAQWANAVNFSTLNGGINLDLPANLSTDVEAETLNGQINSDFPINLTSLKDRRHLRGRIGAGGRELLLKTLNGSINLRLAS